MTNVQVFGLIIKNQEEVLDSNFELAYNMLLRIVENLSEAIQELTLGKFELVKERIKIILERDIPILEKRINLSKIPESIKESVVFYCKLIKDVASRLLEENKLNYVISIIITYLTKIQDEMNKIAQHIKT